MTDARTTRATLLRGWRCRLNRPRTRSSCRVRTILERLVSTTARTNRTADTAPMTTAAVRPSSNTAVVARIGPTTAMMARLIQAFRLLGRSTRSR
ncbi:hypothetical protein EBO15_39085 [Actinomadura harenae]|uniref:Uncharacterized protein n=1 Tax=Actinomadura harenae TaxID=2483351 RepID=A0A3M2LNC6_9ACTN|nr:hypothetical protein EBO15_39085 [Actinomadura harenae]